MAGKINASLLKVLYEVLGESVENIAGYFGVSPTLVQYAVEDAGLTRLPVAESALDWTSMNVVDVSEDVLEQVSHRLRVLQTLKLSAQNPQYIALETLILTKLQDVVSNLPATEASATGKLKDVVSTLVSLRSVPATGLPGEGKNDENHGVNVQVNILGRVDSDYKVAEHQQVRIQGADEGMGQVLP